MIPDDRKNEIRNQLIYDITHPEEKWYSQSSKDNRDIIVVAPECPYSTPGTGRVSEHRYVWWKHHKNDPPLGYGDIIHHINGNHHDNRIENLIRMSAKEHRKQHGKTISESKRINRLKRNIK